MNTYYKKDLMFFEMLMPSNFHVHWRELFQLQHTVSLTAMQFYYAQGMLNVIKPITKPVDASDYCIEVQQIGHKANSHFSALVSWYLTDKTTAEDIVAISNSDNILSGKLYPAGATTNSDVGFTDVEKMYPIFAIMEERDVPLDLHGEVVDKKVALWDRERVFVDKILSKICDKFPQLRIVLEHVSTKEGVQFVLDAPDNVVATVAPQHMLCNCNDVYLHPTMNCYPIINSPADQMEIISFAINSKKAIAGTDSAPHPNDQKFCDGGKGGCFVEPYAVSLYAEAFERVKVMDDRFEQFMSLRGPKFYKLAMPEKYITLLRKPIEVEYNIQIGPGNMYATPFMAGKALQWQIV